MSPRPPGIETRVTTIGPSKMDLMEAFFFDRSKTLRFNRMVTDNLESSTTFLSGKLRGLISMRNPDHFIIILWCHNELAPELVLDHEIVIAYDAAKRHGSMPVKVSNTRPLADFLNRESCNFGK